MVLSDIEIWDYATRRQMIDPFIERQVNDVDGKKVISYGLSSFGYDFRVGNEFKVCARYHTTPHHDKFGTYQRTIDPKKIDQRVFRDMSVPDNEALWVPPHGFVLARTVERFKIPRNIIVEVLGKSTYARSGLILNVTPLEPEWEGQITIELSNTTPVGVLVYAGEGIGQALFHASDKECAVSYADRKGKYQNQDGIVLPRV